MRTPMDQPFMDPLKGPSPFKILKVMTSRHPTLLKNPSGSSCIAQWLPYTEPSTHISMNEGPYRQLGTLGPHAFACFPLMSPNMEITCTSCSKTPLHVHIFLIWEGKPLDPEALTPNLLHKGSSYVQGILVNSTSLYKHHTFSSSRYVKISSSHTIKFSEVFQSLN